MKLPSLSLAITSRFCGPLVACCVLWSLAIPGCSPANPTAGNAPAGPTTGAPTEASDPAMMLVKLQAADKLDGVEDHVVGKCYVCGLGMDGKPEHAAEFEGYTCHLCSEQCREYFAENAASLVQDMTPPGATEDE